MLTQIHQLQKYELTPLFQEFRCEYFERKKHVSTWEQVLKVKELVFLIKFLQFYFFICLFLTNLDFQKKFETCLLHLLPMNINIFNEISFQLTLFLQNNQIHLQKYRVDLLQKFSNKYFHFKLPNKYLLMHNNQKFYSLFKHGKQLNQQEFLCLILKFLNQPNK